MPDVSVYAEIGDVVHYYPGGDLGQRPHAAVVTRIGNGTQVTVNVLSPDLFDTRPIEGVRHARDAGARAAEVADVGAWLPRPLTVALRRMLLDMAAAAWDKTGRLVPVEPAKVKPAA